MVLDEVAMVTGTSDLSLDDRIPYGCGAAGTCDISVNHRPIENAMATTARSLYYLRRAAEDLAHTQNAPSNIRAYAGDIAKYANDLEFFSRQLALGMKMPIMVDEPYLPIDTGEPPQIWKYLGKSGAGAKATEAAGIKAVEAICPLDAAVLAPLAAARPYAARARQRRCCGRRPRSERRGAAAAGRSGHFL
mmetsp:Transcript_10442/g.32260  ORF Transcript_10442/g.32260 Transcript_10442/m.32260 type:complete len:191 (-) Transcript_10442:18-590(-)